MIKKLNNHIKIVLIVFTLTPFCFSGSCSESAEDEEETETATTATDVESVSEASETVNLEAPTPAGVLQLATAAISNTIDINSGIDEGVDLTGLELNAPVEVAAADPDTPDTDSDGDGLLESSTDDATTSPDPDLSSCSLYGEPMANSTTALSEQDSTYARAKVDCLISTPNTSETLAGSISQIKGILCAFENAIGSPIEFEAAPGKSYEVTVTIDTNCFSETQVANMAENGNQFPLTITATRDETKSFPDRLAINLGNSTTIIDLAITEDVFSFAKIESDSESNPEDVTIVTMERSAGIVRAVRKSVRWGDVVTLLVTGEISESGQLASIDRKEAVYGRFGYPSGGGNDNQPSSTDSFNGTFISANGDNANGVHYRYANYRCGSYGDSISSVTGPCTDITSGAFTNRRESCDIRGADSCLSTALTIDGDALPFFSINEHFEYTNPQQSNLEAILTSPEQLCFDEVTLDTNPNSACDGSSTSLTLNATKPKKVNFRRTAQNPGKERRIRDWTSKCGEKEGKINLEYMIGGKRPIGNSLISALNSGSDHKVAFNIMSPFGKFYGDYDITAKVFLNDEELTSLSLQTPDPVVRPDMVEMPITLDSFTSDDTLKLTFVGTFKCGKEEGQAGKSLKAYSMSWAPGGPRILYQP